jgi:hypothetical protein
MKMIAWSLCLAVLVAAVTAAANDEATFFIQDGDVHLQTPSEFGSFFMNGMDVIDTLRKISVLENQVALVMQENKEIKVCDFFTRKKLCFMLNRRKTQCCATWLRT